MTVNAVVTFMVFVEFLLLVTAVRWLVVGVRSAACREWPPIMPVTPGRSLPNPRDGVVRPDEAAAAAS